MGIVFFIVLTALSMFTVSCTEPSGKQTMTVESASFDTTEGLEGLPQPPQVVRLAVVGDIMMHDYQMKRAYVDSSGTFDFSKVFEYVQPYLDESDLLIGNLETVFAGKNKGRDSSVLGYATYPYFNAPKEYAEQLKMSGFDLLTTANNHSLDSYPAGVEATLQLLDSLQIRHVGTYRSEEERSRLCMVEENGVTLGFCGYTYSLNGIREPRERDYLVNDFVGFDTARIHRMCEEVRSLQHSGADMTLAYVHCGEEYQKKPNAGQRRVVDSLRAAGCDIVVMSHPHLLQKIDFFPANDSLKSCFVSYSLGNFISSQVYHEGQPRDIGGILELEITKMDGVARLSKVSFVPTYSFWRKDRIGLLPVIEAYEHPERYLPLWKKDNVNLERAYHATMDVLRGDMDSSRVFMTDGRYRLDLFPSVP